MKNAQVVRVSCCGANELLSIEEVVDFLNKYPNVEIGIGVSKEKCQFGSQRMNWILLLQKKLTHNNGKSRIAFHVNGGWAKEIAKMGRLPKELVQLIWENNGTPRIQLNVIGSGYSLDKQSPTPLANLIQIMEEKQSARFIIPCNDKSLNFISSLQKFTDEFDVLYDASFGFGKQAENYYSFFPNQFQGYAGGLSAENIETELAKIDLVQSCLAKIWVDAEGKLRKDNCNTLDLDKAKLFVDKIFEMNKNLDIER